MLIISTFNPLWFGCIFLFSGLLYLVSKLVKDKPAEVKENIIAFAMIFTFAMFWVYKYSISVDGEYLALRREAGLAGDAFNWWDELCLHLCNINLILLPFAVKLRKRALLFFTSVIGPFGALIALLMPGIGFSGYSLLTGRILGFYFTHYMVMFGGLAVITFGLFKPSYKDIPKGVLTLYVLNFIILLFNLAVRAIGVAPHSNYFYNMETEGNFVLEIFHNWVPVPYLYTLFLIPVVFAYSFLFVWVVNRIQSKKN